MATSSSTVNIKLIDELIQSLEILGPFDRQSPSSRADLKDYEPLEDIQTLTPEVVRREFAASLAGLCVLYAPVNKGDAWHSRDPKANVIATSLIPKDGNPDHLDLISSGNKPLDTMNNNYNRFISASIQKLRDISITAHLVSSTDNANLSVTTIRTSYEDLHVVEKAFICYTYDQHKLKVKQRLLKHLPYVKRAFKGHINDFRKKGEETSIPILQAINNLVQAMVTFARTNGSWSETEILALHKTGRSISSIVTKNRKLFRDLPRLDSRSVEYILTKASTTARQVNNLVILATWSSLRDHLNNHNGKTLVSSFRKGFPWSEDGFKPGKVVGRNIMNQFNIYFPPDPRKRPDPSTVLPPEVWRRLDMSETGDRRSTYVHCECILALEILKKGIPGEYYIGCSKLSCTSCFYFLKAANKYGEHKGITIIMDGTHGVSYLPWSIPRGTPAPFCDTFVKVLLNVVHKTLLKNQDNQPESNSDIAADLVADDEPNSPW